MKATHPHFLLFSEATSEGPAACDQWRFVLQSLDHDRVFSASDQEPLAAGERLELLAVVRGLEALAEPSRVTLVTKSRYVSRGISRGLATWRENDWKWERFGELVTVRDCDLWQRVNRALEFHEIECRAWRFDSIPGQGSTLDQCSALEEKSALGQSPSHEPILSNESSPSHELGQQNVGQQVTVSAEAAAADTSAVDASLGEQGQGGVLASGRRFEMPVETIPGATGANESGWISRADPVYRTEAKGQQGGTERIAAALASSWNRLSQWFHSSRSEQGWANTGTVG